MRYNTYTAAIDSVHVSEAAIEAAIQAAKLRAADTTSNRMKLRYAAIAASVVLAGVGGYALYHNTGGFELPVSPTPAAPSEWNATVPTEHTESNGKSAETERETSGETKKPTEKVAVNDATSPSRKSETTAPSTPSPTQKATQKPTERVRETVMPTQTPQPATSPPTEKASGYIVIEPIDREIDRSELGEDGKLYMMIAPTGLSQIDDPEAFTDDHVYYYETKFGKVYIQPLTIKPIFPYGEPSSLEDSTCYFYNSRGEILNTSSIRWD